MIVVPAARPPRHRIDLKTQKQLARLSRRAHRFHQFAHHPLCGNYAGEVIRIGRNRFCRGCSYALIGGATGGITGLVIGSSTTIPIVTTALAAAIIVATLWTRRRVSKLVTRLAPTFLFTVAMTCGVLGFGNAGILVALAAAMVVGGLRLLYGKRGPDRTPCTTCPERELQPCSGFAPIVSRERAFQRSIRRMIDR